MIEVGRRRVRPSRPDGRQGICVTQAPWAKGTEPPGSVPAPPAGPTEKRRKGERGAEPAVIRAPPAPRAGKARGGIHYYYYYYYY